MHPKEEVEYDDCSIKKLISPELLDDGDIFRKCFKAIPHQDPIDLRYADDDTFDFDVICDEEILYGRTEWVEFP